MMHKEQFAIILRNVAHEEGVRTHAARSVEFGDIYAAAIACSLLTCLRSLSFDRDIKTADIQMMIDEYMRGARMKCVEGPNGAMQFVRTDE